MADTGTDDEQLLEFAQDSLSGGSVAQVQADPLVQGVHLGPGSRTAEEAAIVLGEGV
ncbi:hypothetical protein [Pseudonocardia humida]|uniref:Uncharacterized protein n=1 Tax=Pseudonocardia humida TaxID=2800819 RepID=A0ABT0ZTY2_9PSEU|nr:hypothetical protein [Pseudonocardia humida]MCO1654134.1 hypothetical protein [Pseudonocardia humida]